MAGVEHVELHKAKDGYRWRRREANGRIVSESGEGVSSKLHNRAMAEDKNPGVPVEDHTLSGPDAPTRGWAALP